MPINLKLLINPSWNYKDFVLLICVFLYHFVLPHINQWNLLIYRSIRHAICNLIVFSFCKMCVNIDIIWVSFVVSASSPSAQKKNAHIARIVTTHSTLILIYYVYSLLYQLMGAATNAFTKYICDVLLHITHHQ